MSAQRDLPSSAGIRPAAGEGNDHGKGPRQRDRQLGYRAFGERERGQVPRDRRRLRRADLHLFSGLPDRVHEPAAHRAHRAGRDR